MHKIELTNDELLYLKDAIHKGTGLAARISKVQLETLNKVYMKLIDSQLKAWEDEEKEIQGRIYAENLHAMPEGS